MGYIDFTTDIRDDDVFRIVVEGLYIDGVFKKYGVIVSTEFVNDGNTFRAYRYEINSEADYYNEEGKPLRVKSYFSCKSGKAWYHA